MFRRIFLVTLIVLAAVMYTERVTIQDFAAEMRKPELPVVVTYEEVVEKTALKADLPREEEKEAVNLAVPFTPQAPSGDWNLPFKEACEEASIHMVHEFYAGKGEGTIRAQTATKDIEKIVAFEKELFGFYEDTTVAETATLVEKMYGYGKSEVIENPTVDDIKKELAAGHPVIVPLAGRLLGNPFYTAPGPLYHMLVIRGYTKDGKFITNDPGTRRGNGYLYPFETLMNAMHDWVPSGEIETGKKVVLILREK
jgi:hypothetical protein